MGVNRVVPVVPRTPQEGGGVVTHGPRISRLVTTGAVIAVLSGALAAVPASAAVERPAGAGPPTPGAGIGTSAALDNPQCVLNERTKPYGRFDWTSVGDGPVCVKPWDDGDDNGGATYQGVTADRVKVVVILPNDTQRGRAVAVVTHRAGEPRRQHRRHARRLGARLPAAADEVLRDVGP